MPSARVLVLALLCAAGSGIGDAAADGEDTDCNLSREALHSYLDIRSPRIAKVVRTHRKDRMLEQTVRLSSGMNVTFAVYGCEYLAYRFSFRPLPGVTGSTPLAGLARTALEQLATVPVLPAERVSVTELQAALSSETAIAKTEPNADGSYTINLPDDFADYILSVPEPGVLQVEYNVLL